MRSSKSARNSIGHLADRELDQKAGQQSGDSPLCDVPVAKKSPRPSQCRNFTRDAVAESMPEIVDAFVDQAKQGSVSHFNLLSKFGGFDQRPIQAPARRRGKSFAQKLLENMKEHEARMIAANEARIATERAAAK